ncbi:TVB29 protein, partial [Galbula dea]|nr:TVB29 protein [Galbula dea]
LFWYQQPPRNSLKLIVSTSTWMQSSYEEGYSEAKFEISRHSNGHFVMTIRNVTSEDAARYFCAASDR